MEKINIGKPPAGYRSIAVMTPYVDYSLEQAIGIMSPYLKDEKYAVIVGGDSNNPIDILRCSPDLVIFFRSGAFHPPELRPYEANLQHAVGLCKVLGIPTVYYADDLVFPLNEGLPIKVAIHTDKVIVSSQFLKEWLYAHEFPRSISVFPTCINLERVAKAATTHWLIDPTKFNVLVYSVHGTSVSALHSMFSYINEYPAGWESFRFIIVTKEVGKLRMHLNEFRKVNKAYHDYMPTDELYALVKACDVQVDLAHPSDVPGIVPGAEIAWINSKSPIKYLVAGACGKPFIAPAIPPYDCIKHGETGYKITTSEEALMLLELLRDDRGLMEKVGHAAKNYVESEWDVKTRYPQFKKQIISSEKSTPITKIVNQPIKVGWILCGPMDVPSARIEGMNIHTWINEHSEAQSEIMYQPARFVHHIITNTKTVQEAVDKNYDVVVFQKVCLGDSVSFAKDLHSKGIKVLWSISDLLSFGFPLGEEVDKIITTNKYLRSKFPELLQKKTVLIKDAYESPPSLYKNSYLSGENLKVVWFGSAAGFKTSQFIKEITDALGMEFITISSPDVNPTKIWRYETIFADLMENDILVITSDLNDEFSKCKDENKLIQSMVLGMPVVASPIPAYMDIRSEEGIDSWLVAESPVQFYTSIEKLRSPEMREILGHGAHQQVRDAYNIATIGSQFMKEIKACLEN